MLEFENEMISKGYKLIAGVDEAGRGPLAGAVFVAMAIMPLDMLPLLGVKTLRQLQKKAQHSA